MMQMMKKRTAAILMTLLAMAVIACFVLIVGTPVYAESGDSAAIQFVKDGAAPNIAGAQVSSVYFGNYLQSDSGETDSEGNKIFNKDPVKWRVLNNADGRLFLLSDRILDYMKYNEIQAGVTWETCTLRAWLNGGITNGGKKENNYEYTNNNFIEEAFTDREKNAIVTTTIINDDNTDYNTLGGEPTDDQVFLLALKEVVNTDYGFANDNSGLNNRIIKNSDYTNSKGASCNTIFGSGDWWLRSPGSSGRAATVPNNSIVSSAGTLVDSDEGVCPAMNVSLNSVLFTSAAEDGKISGTEGADALTEVGNNSTDEWKLTLKDDGSENAAGNDHQGFKVDSVSNCDGKTLSIQYSGAVTGNNEFISAVIKDSDGKIKYYGRIKNCTDVSAAVEINISGKLGTGDKLYLFNEQYNEDKKTDYASDLKEVSVPDHKETTITTKATLTKNGSVVKKCSVCEKEFSSTTIYYPKTFKLSAASYTYNGKAKKPSVTVTDANGKNIAASNYSVAYSNNVKAGKNAAAKITFKGSRYSGSKTLTFTINKAANPLTVKAKTATVKFSAVKKKAQTVAVSKVLAVSKNQGKVIYAKASGNAKITINKTTGKVTVKKGLKKGTFKVKVKVKAAGNANYKALTKALTFTVKIK